MNPSIDENRDARRVKNVPSLLSKSDRHDSTSSSSSSSTNVSKHRSFSADSFSSLSSPGEDFFAEQGRILREMEAKLYQCNLTKLDTKLMNSMRERKITLNVGGIKYDTYISTLSKYPDTLLGTMFAARTLEVGMTKNQKEYFMDRDGELFRHVLNFYRRGEVYIEPNTPLKALRDEMEYFMLPHQEIERIIDLAAQEDERVERDRHSRMRHLDQERDMEFGKELSTVAISALRSKVVAAWPTKTPQKDIDDFYTLLIKQTKMALMHAARQGKFMRVTVALTSKGQTFFGEDSEGNPCFIVMNVRAANILETEANRSLLVHDLKSMNIKVTRELYLESPNSDKWLLDVSLW